MHPPDRFAIGRCGLEAPHYGADMGEQTVIHPIYYGRKDKNAKNTTVEGPKMARYSLLRSIPHTFMMYHFLLSLPGALVSVDQVSSFPLLASPL